MGADRVGTAVGARCGADVRVAGCGVVLLAGCASMPDSGDMRGGRGLAAPDSQVRVFAVPPREDATPTEIVEASWRR